MISSEVKMPFIFSAEINRFSFDPSTEFRVALKNLKGDKLRINNVIY